MIVLGIESATERVGVAVADEDGVRAELWVSGRRRHTETLAPAITEVLDHADRAVEDLSAVAVDLGPGLFTGLRVGVATAKGLGQGLGVGVVGLSSLTLLARAAAEAGVLGRIVAVIDARRSEVFSAVFEVETVPPGALAVPVVSQRSAPRVSSPEALASLLVAAGGGDGRDTVAVGDGARRYADLLTGVPGLRVAGATLAAPAPSLLAAMALEHLAGGGPASDPAHVAPLYLRDADARINWTRRAATGRGR